MFGEVMVEDEYNPTAPTNYSSFKQKREQLRLKEKIAKEIADRLAKEASEDEEKRRKGAALRRRPHLSHTARQHWH
uniref:Pre-mRNA-processing protein 45 n=1 Tax=Globodera pallida TaxID=36090 RepID=A0A183CS02_GLOPA